MANICDTQYKVTGSRKAVADLWNTLQELEVISNSVYLYLLAEHYGIDYEKKGISALMAATYTSCLALFLHS